MEKIQTLDNSQEMERAQRVSATTGHPELKQPRVVAQPNAATEPQKYTFDFDYRAWWSESQLKNNELKQEIEDLKAQIDRLKAVLKDSL